MTHDSGASFFSVLRPPAFSSPRCVLFPIKCYRLRPWSVPFFRIYKKVWIYNVFRIQSRSDETIRNRWVEAKRFPHPVTCFVSSLEIIPRSPPRFARRLAPPNLTGQSQSVTSVNGHPKREAAVLYMAKNTDMRDNIKERTTQNTKTLDTPETSEKSVG